MGSHKPLRKAVKRTVGATSRFSAAVAPESDASARSAGSPGSGTFSRTQPRDRLLVLVVDDAPIAAVRLKELLIKANYEVATATNGFEAIALTKELRPDVVLLDIEMPGKNGIEVCAELKQDPKTWRTLVVLLTASDEPRHLRDGFRAGCDGYISKGTADAELLRKLSVKLLPGTSLQAGRR